MMCEKYKDDFGKYIQEGDLLFNKSFGDVWVVIIVAGAYMAKLLPQYDPQMHTVELSGLVGFEIIGTVHRTEVE